VPGRLTLVKQMSVHYTVIYSERQPLEDCRNTNDSLEAVKQTLSLLYGDLSDARTILDERRKRHIHYTPAPCTTIYMFAWVISARTCVEYL
jgi:hypothetical protein